MTQLVTSGCTGQISAVTFLRGKKAAIKNLLGEPGVNRNEMMKLFSLLLVMFLLLTPETSAAKYCKYYRSCAEVIADYPDGRFEKRDGDNDGIPCENVCRSRQQVEDLLNQMSRTQKSKSGKNK